MTTEHPVDAPPWWRTVSETRAAIELGAFVAASPALRLVGPGDRHPVLVLPGLTATDLSTGPLRWFLRGQGYWTHGWHLGRNLGPTREVLDGLEARFRYVRGRHDRKITLVGWSLGGIYARWLAQRHPEAIRQVITMGTPFRVEPGDHTAAELIWDRIQARLPADAHELFRTHVVPADVPVTAIYTRTDGIVDWHLCVQETGPLRENVEVHGSHSGLGFNPAVLICLADRMHQREHEWKPFRPAPGIRSLYSNL